MRQKNNNIEKIRFVFDWNVTFICSFAYCVYHCWNAGSLLSIKRFCVIWVQKTTIFKRREKTHIWKCEWVNKEFEWIKRCILTYDRISIRIILKIVRIHVCVRVCVFCFQATLYYIMIRVFFGSILDSAMVLTSIKHVYSC